MNVKYVICWYDYIRWLVLFIVLILWYLSFQLIQKQECGITYQVRLVQYLSHLSEKSCFYTFLGSWHVLRFFSCFGPIGGSYEKAVKVCKCPRMKIITNWADPKESFTPLELPTPLEGRTISLLAVEFIVRNLMLLFLSRRKNRQDFDWKKLKTRKFEKMKKWKMKNEKNRKSVTLLQGFSDKAAR